MDQLTTVNEIDAVSLEAISKLTQMYLQEASMLLGTISDYSALVSKGMKSLALPRFAGFVVEDKVAATKLTMQTSPADSDILLLNKHKGIGVEIEDIAELQSNVDLMKEYALRMSKDLAYKIDQDIADCLDNASASAPDHRLAFDNGTSFTKADFTKAKKLLKKQNVPTNDLSNLFLGISPELEEDILNLSDFVDADKYLSGSEQIKLNGVIGRLYGFNVVVSNAFSDDRALFYHRTHVAYATQQAPKFEIGREIKSLADIAALSSIYGCQYLDNGVRAVEIGSAT